jgi:hypothetical protein
LPQNGFIIRGHLSSSRYGRSRSPLATQEFATTTKEQIMKTKLIEELIKKNVVNVTYCCSYEEL